MVQTEKGAARNEWIAYMHECSAAYRARKEAERGPESASEGPADAHGAANDKGARRAKDEGPRRGGKKARKEVLA